MLALLKAFAVLAPVVKNIVVEIVKAIGGSPDPQDAARRALIEASRVRAFDELMARRRG